MDAELDAWIAAYAALERDMARLDWQWQRKHNALLVEHHRLNAELNEYVAAEAAARLLNREEQEAEGCPF